MSKIKITKRLIDSTDPGDRDQVIFDSEISGFGLKVASSGRKTFILKYRNASGRQRKPTIGRYGDITLEQARKIAREWHAEIIKGGDPSADKRKKVETCSLNEFAERYFAQADKKPSTLEMERGNFRMYVASSLGGMQITDIKRANVQNWFDAMASKPAGANRTISLLSAMFNEAERRQLTPEFSNPCRAVRRYPAKSRERYLSPSELKRFLAALDDAEQRELFHPSVVPAFRLLLLTGARKSEVLTMRWEWVDFVQKCVLLPDSKTGARKLYLSDDAIEVLRAQPRLRDNEFVFFGAKVGDHYHELKKPFKKLLAKAGIEDFRIHDLRHTHASYAVKSGVPLNVIAKTLGHSQTRTTERYAHVDDIPALDAVEGVSRQFRLTEKIVP